MIKPGDRVLAFDHRLWAKCDLEKVACIKHATVIEVRYCENVPLDDPYRVLADVVFDYDNRIARSYFVDNLKLII